MIKKIIDWLKKLFKTEPVTGSLPSPYDERDYILSSSSIESQKDKLIPSFTEWGYVPDQLRYETCVAFSINRLLQITMYRDGVEESGLKDTTRRFSELYLWHYAKKECGWEDKNKGVYIRNAFKALFKYGFVPYTMMPYTGSMLRKPSIFSDRLGTSFIQIFNKRKDYKYYKAKHSQIPSLIKKGIPILIGTYTSKSMYNSKYTKDEPNNGYGHAMVIEGLKERNGISYAKTMNWWGKGYLYIPLSYIKNNTYEYWVLENNN